MKATTWLCPVLTLLCATRIVCTAQRSSSSNSNRASSSAVGIGYPLDYADANLIQDDFLLEKRNKPSLSIANPLDVLRQRLLLEIARRQMKENTRQVELNRAILKNVGKRMSNSARYELSPAMLLEMQQLLQQQQQPRQAPYSHIPLALDYMPTATLFDLLQKPQTTAYEISAEGDVELFPKKPPNGKNELKKHSKQQQHEQLQVQQQQQQLQQQQQPHQSQQQLVNENEIALDRNLEEQLLQDAVDAGNSGYPVGYGMARLHKNHFAK